MFAAPTPLPRSSALSSAWITPSRRSVTKLNSLSRSRRSKTDGPAGPESSEPLKGQIQSPETRGFQAIFISNKHIDYDLLFFLSPDQVLKRNGVFFARCVVSQAVTGRIMTVLLNLLR